MEGVPTYPSDDVIKDSDGSVGEVVLGSQALTPWG